MTLEPAASPLLQRSDAQLRGVPPRMRRGGCRPSIEVTTLRHQGRPFLPTSAVLANRPSRCVSGSPLPQRGKRVQHCGQSGARVFFRTRSAYTASGIFAAVGALSNANELSRMCICLWSHLRLAEGSRRSVEGEQESHPAVAGSRKFKYSETPNAASESRKRSPVTSRAQELRGFRDPHAAIRYGLDRALTPNKDIRMSAIPVLSSLL